MYTFSLIPKLIHPVLLFNLLDIISNFTWSDWIVKTLAKISVPNSVNIAIMYLGIGLSSLLPIPTFFMFYIMLVLILLMLLLLPIPTFFTFSIMLSVDVADVAVVVTVVADAVVSVAVADVASVIALH
ncbi:unnamed protein product, partial [Meganyctiphanes norvegica]